MQVPCGQCVGCRVDNAKQWAARCIHEAQTHEDACFVTLTYDDEHLPQYSELRPDHWQKFVKRLRKYVSPKKLRYFHCGEYGETTQRPHYHALLFGWEPTDKVRHTGTGATTLYTSDTLARIWGYGFVTVGNVTAQSAGYVARYTLKKLSGERYFAPLIDFSTGEINELQNVYATMSKRPGIGSEWLKKYKSDVYPDDFVLLDGMQSKTPRYYDKILEKTHLEEYERIRKNRRQRSKRYEADNTPERLIVREKVANAKLNKLTKRL